jgi:methanogenic corrinoid protein MtbC1
MSDEILQQLATCIERGRVNKAAPWPKDMAGQDGADELTQQALAEGLDPQRILTEGCVVGMEAVSAKYSEKKAFITDLLMSAKAMQAVMGHLKPFFESGEVKQKGTVIMGTVQRDLHDIGKNIVRMVLEGGGYKVVDLGVDVSPEAFLQGVKDNPGAAVGLSALLTTTMVNMEKTVQMIKENDTSTIVMVGGAPLNEEFANKIGADCYSPDPQGALKYLNKQWAS